MKKTKKLLGLAVLCLSAGALVACGGPAEESKAEPCKTHKWADKETTKAPTCTEKGEKLQECTVCGATQKKEVKEAGHKYVEDATQGVAATCTVDGKKVSKCSVCNDVKEDVVKATGHTAAAAADQTGAVAPTCDATGTEKQECSVCHAALEDKTVDALGHEFGETVWEKEATCTEAGAGTKTCTRAGCTHSEEVVADALGHDIQLIGDESEPEAGKAKVRVYTCANECGQTYLGFKASEASADSLDPEKGHLIVGEDGGAKFWGQPIGNDVVLNENGDATADDHEAVFNPAQEGNYFEYKFDLTAEQVATLGTTQHLYCEAKAANYLNNKDFWAADGGEEWTPGMYPEAVGDHEAGDLIQDYRYILYVDGQPQVFNSEMKAPVTGSATNQPKKEYVMPYEFHLHEGENSIRLVMAGGYKSTFYNFTFRPVVSEEGPAGDHEHEPVAGAKAETSALRALSCSCGSLTGYELQAADCTEGQKTPAESGQGNTEKGSRLGKTIMDDVWNITGITAGQYDLYLKARASQGNDTAGYWNSATAVANGDSASNNGNSTDYKYKVKVDDGEYTPIGNDVDNYAATGLNTTAPAWTNKAMARITVPAGATTLTIHNMNNGYSIWVYAARLVKVA